MKKIILFIGIFAIGMLVAPSESEAKTVINNQNRGGEPCFDQLTIGNLDNFRFCGDCHIKSGDDVAYPNTCGGSPFQNK